MPSPVRKRSIFKSLVFLISPLNFVLMPLSNNLFRPWRSGKMLFLAAGLLLMAPVAQAQDGAPGPRPGGRKAERLGQLENAKIAFISSRVSLTQEQAQRFWPLYNEFSTKRRDLNRNGRLLRRDITDAMTDAQIRDNMQQAFALRQQELNLEKDYFEKFQKVITLRQVAQLLIAERNFTKEVIRRVAGQRGEE